MPRILHTNEYLLVKIPALNRVLVFRIKSRINEGYEEIDYGKVPIRAGTTLPMFGGGSVEVPEDGILPGMSYMPSNVSVAFPSLVAPGVSDEDDMFYISSKDFSNRVIHVIAYFKPEWVRVLVDVPVNTIQPLYQNATLDIDKDLGFKRGTYELVYLPDIRAGWRFANDTNLDVYLTAKFRYGEYEVETVKEPELVFDLITGEEEGYMVVLPIYTSPYGLVDTIKKVYGFEGYPVYPKNKKAEAVKEYSKLALLAKV